MPNNIKFIDTAPTKATTASEIMKTVETDLVNGFINSNLTLSPKLIISDHNNGIKVLSDITSELIDTYEDTYKKQKEYAKKSIIPRITQFKRKPNKMQVAAITSLTKLKKSVLNKALIISATGTGKTYLSAFDVRNFNPRRALFVVHREQLAKQALNSSSNVFGDTRSMGILSGTSKALDKDFIFSIIQTL